jgi:Tol biopolymer transport system component
MNVRIRFAFVVLLSIVCLPAFAKTPLTVDKLLKLKRVSDPQVSPDSQWVAYTVTEMNATENNSNSDIYLMKMDGSKRLRLTQFAKADNTPRWRPDGKLLTFLSSRSGSMQIWSFPIDGSIGGEPTQLTDLAMDVDSYNWSNDGKNILFTSTVFKDCDDNACNKKKSDEEEKNKLKVRIIEDDLYRHWDGWLTDGKHSRLFRLQVADKKITALSPRGLFVPPVALEGNNDFTISPDGKEVAYVTNTDKDLSRSTNNDIFLTDLAGKPAQRLTAANLSNDNTPTYSPDGRFIAYRSQEIPGFESDRIRLKLYDRRSHTHMEVSKDAPIDNWVQEIAWGADGKNLYFTTEDQGYDSVFSYNLDEKRLTKLTEKMAITILTSAKPESYPHVAELLKKQWEAVGAKVNLDVVADKKEFQDKLTKRQYDVVLFGQSLFDNLDSYPYWHSSQIQEKSDLTKLRLDAFNLSQYASFEADQLLTRIRETGDNASRAQALKDLNTLWKKDTPAVVLYSPLAIYAHDDSVHGISFQRLSLHADRFAHIDEWYVTTRKKFKDGKHWLSFIPWLFGLIHRI